MTPKQYTKYLIRKFDVTINQGPYHKIQVLKCCKKTIEIKLVTLDRINAPCDTIIFFENVLKEIETKLNNETTSEAKKALAR